MEKMISKGNTGSYAFTKDQAMEQFQQRLNMLAARMGGWSLGSAMMAAWFRQRATPVFTGMSQQFSGVRFDFSDLPEVIHLPKFRRPRSHVHKMKLRKTHAKCKGRHLVRAYKQNCGILNISQVKKSVQLMGSITGRIPFAHKPV